MPMVSVGCIVGIDILALASDSARGYGLLVTLASTIANRTNGQYDTAGRVALDRHANLEALPNGGAS